VIRIIISSSHRNGRYFDLRRPLAADPWPLASAASRISQEQPPTKQLEQVVTPDRRGSTSGTLGLMVKTRSYSHSEQSLLHGCGRIEGSFFPAGFHSLNESESRPAWPFSAPVHQALCDPGMYSKACPPSGHLRDTHGFSSVSAADEITIHAGLPRMVPPAAPERPGAVIGCVERTNRSDCRPDAATLFRGAAWDRIIALGQRLAYFLGSLPRYVPDAVSAYSWRNCGPKTLGGEPLAIPH
jgi:hypothetical protein